MTVERLRYFTGLFLEEQDFRLEQMYHLQMRRMLNFALFTPGVLFGLTVAREATDRVRVDPGMAVDSHQGEQQGHEIVLTGSQIVNLNDFANGAQIYITIAYGEQPTAPKPPLNIESRVTEDPLIERFLDTGTGFSQDKNLKIILAKVTVGNFSPPDVTERQLAQLRLAGGGGASGGPTVTSLTFNNSLNQGSTAVMTINGTNLGNTLKVAILDMDNKEDPLISAIVNLAESGNTVLIVNIEIKRDAVVGDRKVQVQTGNGTVITNPVEPTAFVVIPPAPVIDEIEPRHGRQTVSRLVTITGSNLAAAPVPVVTILHNNRLTDGEVRVTRTEVSPDGTSISATLEIGEDAVPGGRRMRVETAGGQAESVPDFFEVRPVPKINSLDRQSQVPDEHIVIIGSDIRADPVGSAATFTTVSFVNPQNPNVFETGSSPIVLPDINTRFQQIRVTVPHRGETLPNNVEVRLEIEEAKSNLIPFTILGDI